MIYLNYPYQVANNGQTATTDYISHVRQMIELILFTQPKERVNRPNFGTGLMELVFNPIDLATSTTAQVMIQASLQQWLGNEINVEDVTVDNIENRLEIAVTYTISQSNETYQDTFIQENVS